MSATGHLESRPPSFTHSDKKSFPNSFDGPCAVDSCHRYESVIFPLRVSVYNADSNGVFTTFPNSGL